MSLMRMTQDEWKVRAQGGIPAKHVFVTQLVKIASEDTLQPYYINACTYDMKAAIPSPCYDAHHL